jgi:hypothetical protein
MQNVLIFLNNGAFTASASHTTEAVISVPLHMSQQAKVGDPQGTAVP